MTRKTWPPTLLKKQRAIFPPNLSGSQRIYVGFEVNELKESSPAATKVCCKTTCQLLLQQIFAKVFFLDQK